VKTCGKFYILNATPDCNIPKRLKNTNEIKNHFNLNPIILKNQIKSAKNYIDLNL
jgi:hypothetical protein